MSPRLAEAIEGLDASVAAALASFNITSHVVIANNWGDAEEFSNELWEHAPLDDLNTLWRRSESLCKLRVKSASHAAATGSHSKTSDASSSSAGPATGALTLSANERLVKPRARPNFTVNMIKIAARKKPRMELSVAPKNLDSDHLQASAMAEEMWSIALALQSKSSVCKELEATPEDLKADFKSLFVD